MAVQSRGVGVAVRVLAECCRRVLAPRRMSPWVWVWQHYSPAMARFGCHLWKLEVVGLKHPSPPLMSFIAALLPLLIFKKSWDAARNLDWRLFACVLGCLPGWGCAQCSFQRPVPVRGWALQLPEPLVGTRRGFALCWGMWQLQKSIPNVEGSVFFPEMNMGKSQIPRSDLYNDKRSCLSNS